ncbi:Proliferating cell nuclear antigen [Entamoeba marina]
MSAFHAKFQEAQLFKKIIDSLKTTLEKANLDCSEVGIAVQCMDNSHVTLVSLLIQKAAFEEYTCSTDFTLGVNITHLGKILKALDNDSVLTLDVDSKSSGVLNVTAESRGRTLKFGLNLVDIDTESVEIPDIEYDAIVTLQSNEFLKITRDFSQLGDESLTIDVEKKKVDFISHGSMCETVMSLTQDTSIDDSTFEIEFNNKVSESFGLKNLAEFAKSAAISDKVKLNLTSGNPLVVEYIGEACTLKFYLAPKFDEAEGEAEEEAN